MSNQSHRSEPRVLNRRTLERDHRRLEEEAGELLVDLLHPLLDEQRRRVRAEHPLQEPAQPLDALAEAEAAVATGDVVAYTDSAGLVSVAVNGGNAAQRLGLPPGARISIAAIPQTINR